MPREANKAYVKDCLEDTNKKDKNAVIVSTQNLAEFRPHSFLKLFQRTQTALICFIRTFSLVDGSCTEVSVLLLRVVNIRFSADTAVT